MELIITSMTHTISLSNDFSSRVSFPLFFVCFCYDLVLSLLAAIWDPPVQVVPVDCSREDEF